MLTKKICAIVSVALLLPNMQITAAPMSAENKQLAKALGAGAVGAGLVLVVHHYFKKSPAGCNHAQGLSAADVDAKIKAARCQGGHAGLSVADVDARAQALVDGLRNEIQAKENQLTPVMQGFGQKIAKLETDLKELTEKIRDAGHEKGLTPEQVKQQIEAGTKPLKDELADFHKLGLSAIHVAGGKTAGQAINDQLAQGVEITSLKNKVAKLEQNEADAKLARGQQNKVKEQEKANLTDELAKLKSELDAVKKAQVAAPAVPAVPSASDDAGVKPAEQHAVPTAGGAGAGATGDTDGN